MSDKIASYLSVTLGLVEVVSAFVLVICQQKITPDAGVQTPAQRWSLLRRLFYTVLAAAMFFNGVWHIDYANPTDPWESLTMILIITLGVMFFPVLRALQVISQDGFTTSNGVDSVLRKITHPSQQRANSED